MKGEYRLVFLVSVIIGYPSFWAQHCQPLESFHFGLEHTTVHCELQDTVCVITLSIEMLQTMIMYEVYWDGTRSPRGHMAFVDEKNGEICRADGKELFSNFTAPTTADGFSRMYLAINGHSPGPTIIGYRGQVMQIKVVNSLREDAVSIHWHGQMQRGNYWMDGVGHITQCPILPGGSFTYTFTLTEPGTHWYHSHMASQRSDGLYGALIVLEPEEESESTIVDDPSLYTLLLHDWYEEWSMDTFMKIHTTVGYYPNGPLGGRYTNTVGPDGTDVGGYPFWSALINGRGRHYHIDSKNKNHNNNNNVNNNNREENAESDDHSTCVSNMAPLHTFIVEYGKVYRIRVIGVQSNYAFRLSVQGHRFSVYATDGHKLNYTDQLVDFLIVNSGERYDILLPTNSTPGKYWIHTETLEIDAKDPCPHHHMGSAILEYKDASTLDEGPVSIKRACSQAKPCVAVNCPFRNYAPQYNITCVNAHELIPLHRDTPPNNGVPEEIFLNFGFHGLSRIVRSTINGISFKHPSNLPGRWEDDIASHTSNTFCSIGINCKEGSYCHCTHTVNVSFNSTVQLVLSNVDYLHAGSIAHPVHIHGHSFHVVGVGYPQYNFSTGFYVADNRDIKCINSRCTRLQWRKPVALTLDRPVVKKDTVIVPAGGYTVIRFRADNPGIWLLHCHIEAHHLEGMSLIINEAAELHPPTPENFPQCLSGYVRNISNFKQEQIRVGISLKCEEDKQNANNNSNCSIWLQCAKILVGALLITSVVGHIAVLFIVFRFTSRRQQRRMNFVMCVIFPSCTLRMYFAVSSVITFTLLFVLIMLVQFDHS